VAIIVVRNIVLAPTDSVVIKKYGKKIATEVTEL